MLGYKNKLIFSVNLNNIFHDCSAFAEFWLYCIYYKFVFVQFKLYVLLCYVMLYRKC